MVLGVVAVYSAVFKVLVKMLVDNKVLTIDDKRGDGVSIDLPNIAGLPKTDGGVE